MVVVQWSNWDLKIVVIIDMWLLFGAGRSVRFLLIPRFFVTFISQLFRENKYYFYFYNSQHQPLMISASTTMLSHRFEGTKVTKSLQSCLKKLSESCHCKPIVGK